MFSRFVLAGAANTALTYLLYLGLLRLLPYLPAYLLTYLAGIALGYALNSTWVFGGQPNIRTAVAYPLIYVLNLLLSMGLLACLVELFHFSKEIAPIIVLAISVPSMYVATRTLFKRGRAP